MTSITYIGMDVHTTNYTLCAFTMEGKKAFGRTTINPDIRPCLKNGNMPKRRIFFRQRSGVRINQHRIDVILREALPMIRNTQPEDVGVIAPYRDQVEKIACQLGSDEIEIDTVHKFQGREKDTIVLTTVDDVITAFPTIRIFSTWLFPKQKTAHSCGIRHGAAPEQQHWRIDRFLGSYETRSRFSSNFNISAML